MRIGQVDLLARLIRLEPGTTKNGDGREVTVTDSVYILLSGCVHAKEPDDFVFTWQDGRPVRDFRGTWASGCRKGSDDLASGCLHPLLSLVGSDWIVQDGPLSYRVDFMWRFPPVVLLPPG